MRGSAKAMMAVRVRPCTMDGSLTGRISALRAEDMGSSPIRSIGQLT